jgi:glycosyltransferase involved in cell wall biosynthesis
MKQSSDNSSIEKASPLVSVLMCNFNYAAYIEDAIESVLSQDYPNIELVIVDDGSTDKSTKIIGKYQENKNVKTIFLKNNQGLCYARNRAIDASTGDFLLFFDSDDLLPRNYITSMYNILI